MSSVACIGSIEAMHLYSTDLNLRCVPICLCTVRPVSIEGSWGVYVHGLGLEGRVLPSVFAKGEPTSSACRSEEVRCFRIHCTNSSL